MSVDATGSAPRTIEIWGGVEATCNRVGDRWFDQLVWSGHDRRTDDLDRLAGLGLTAVRYPVLMDRHAPRSPEQIDWGWSDARLHGLRRLGVRPIVGLLHHGSGPAYTSLLDANLPDRLARFAGSVARRYPWVEDFTPINEPLTTARFSALYGHWYPHGRDTRLFVRALLNQIMATRAAMEAIRAVTPAARLIQTEDCGEPFGSAGVSAQIAHERDRRWLTWDLLTGRVTPDHPMHEFLLAAGIQAAELSCLVERPCPPDVVGLNYYVTSDRYLDEEVGRYAESSHGTNGTLKYADVEAVRARREGIVGHYDHLVAAWQRYRLPVAITEVHMGCTRDEQMRWLAESWHAAEAAASAGVAVKAVTAWALFGSYNWDSLVTRDSAHYEPGPFDVRSPRPRRTALATLVRDIADGRPLTHPVLAGSGWWNRPERLFHQHGRSQATDGQPPILVVGSNGPITRSLLEICAERSLRWVLVSPTALRQQGAISLLRMHQPWAVLNVSTLEHHGRRTDNDHAIWRDVETTLDIARACRTSDVPLVLFSSDEVFDGSKRSPYVESDEGNPQTLLGRAHLEAERCARDLSPTSLIVRTSALFGHAASGNVLQDLLAALEADEPLTAPAHLLVSPTYIPDAVHATLDLLIDGESGVWHLTNDTPVTAWEFATLASSLSPRGRDQIRRAPLETDGGDAATLSCRALGSERGHLLRPLAGALTAYFEACRRLAAIPHRT